MKILKEQMVEQIKVALEDEFNARVWLKKKKIIIEFENGQRFSVAISEK